MRLQSVLHIDTALKRIKTGTWSFIPEELFTYQHPILRTHFEVPTSLRKSRMTANWDPMPECSDTITYWCPCKSSVRPLRPPMSHIMTLWSEAPEKSSLWTGSHHSAPTLPGCKRKQTHYTCFHLLPGAQRDTGSWCDLLAPPSARWEKCSQFQVTFYSTTLLMTPAII